MKAQPDTPDASAEPSDEDRQIPIDLTIPPSEPLPTPRYIIRTIRLAHCKRGPSVCPTCRELDADAICLLDLCPPRQGEVQRRLVELVQEGEPVWREYDITRTFDTKPEAVAYAEEHGIEDVQF
jgi:hypothetical protein